MNYKGYLFSLLLILKGAIYAQSDFRPGYIINLEADTIYGVIDYRGDLLMGESCRFKTESLDNVKVYSPVDLIAYRLKGGKYFISKEINSRKVFLEFLVKGKLNVYYLRDNRGDHYFVEKEASEITELPYEEVIRYKDDKRYSYNTTKHIGLLKIYTQDAPELQLRIANIGSPNHDNLTRLAKDYHYIVCKNEPCIIFKKKEPFIKFNIEIILGVGNYPAYSKNSYFLQPGILANIWMPRVNEKLYFRAGLLYSNFETDDFLKVPLKLEYVYPKGIIAPKIAYGINIYRIRSDYFSLVAHSVAFMIGMNVNLRKSLSLVINYDIDFYPRTISILPKSILSHSISTGILLRL